MPVRWLLGACALWLAMGRAAVGQPLRVVATTSLVGDAVIRVGGARVQVTVLLPRMIDPHGFEPSPRDAVQLAHADVVFMNGAGLETFLHPFLASAAPQIQPVSVSRDVPLRRMEVGAADDDHAQGFGGTDPHVWWDPRNVQRWLDVIREELTARDPVGAGVFQRNAEAYRADLEKLDVWVTQQIARIPPDRRKLVSDHALFGYFAARYGLMAAGHVLSSGSTLAQPSAEEMTDLLGTLERDGISTVFVGLHSNPELAARLCEDTGGRQVGLYTCSLSRSDGPAATYIDFMKFNVSAIVEALSDVR